MIKKILLFISIIIGIAVYLFASFLISPTNSGICLAVHGGHNAIHKLNTVTFSYPFSSYQSHQQPEYQQPSYKISSKIASNQIVPKYNYWKEDFYDYLNDMMANTKRSIKTVHKVVSDKTQDVVASIAPTFSLDNDYDNDYDVDSTYDSFDVLPQTYLQHRKDLMQFVSDRNINLNTAGHQSQTQIQSQQAATDNNSRLKEVNPKGKAEEYVTCELCDLCNGDVDINIGIRDESKNDDDDLTCSHIKYPTGPEGDILIRDFCRNHPDVCFRLGARTAQLIEDDKNDDSDMNFNDIIEKEKEKAEDCFRYVVASCELASSPIYETSASNICLQLCIDDKQMRICDAVLSNGHMYNDKQMSNVKNAMLLL